MANRIRKLGANRLMELAYEQRGRELKCKAHAKFKNEPKKLKAELAHIDEFFNKVCCLNEIKELDPRDFEWLVARILKAYGFVDVDVTGRSHDGGIDGKARLLQQASPPAIALQWACFQGKKLRGRYIGVKFQAKCWMDKKVSSDSMRQFIGTAKDECKVGLFFTTTKFTKPAIMAAKKVKPFPIGLFDGWRIAALVLKKNVPIQNHA